MNQSDLDRRRQRDGRTLDAMIRIYCQGMHGTDTELCELCQQLQRYAQRRLGSCVFGADKPVCSKCPVHCYSASMRDQIKAVMAYAGPRMLTKHPILATQHLLDQFRPVPNSTKK